MQKTNVLAYKWIDKETDFVTDLVFETKLFFSLHDHAFEEWESWRRAVGKPNKSMGFKNRIATISAEVHFKAQKESLVNREGYTNLYILH